MAERQDRKRESKSVLPVWDEHLSGGNLSFEALRWGYDSKNGWETVVSVNTCDI